MSQHVQPAQPWPSAPDVVGAPASSPDQRPLPSSLALAELLDNHFRLPGTNIRFGWDAIIGLVPVVGDTLSAGLGGLILADAVKIGARKSVIAKMAWNLGVDWVLGLVPVVDLVADVAFKANLRNAKLLREEWHRLEAERRLKPQ